MANGFPQSQGRPEAWRATATVRNCGRPAAGLCTALLAAFCFIGQARAVEIGEGSGTASASRAEKPAVTIGLRNPSTTVGRYRVSLDKLLDVSGSAETGSQIEVLVDGSVVAEALAGRSGRWFAKKIAVTPGLHTVAARATAPDGAVDTSRPLRVRVAPPALIRLDELKQNEGFSISRVPTDRFNHATAAAAGDINCDGFADLYVNALPDGGKVDGAFVLFGRADGFPRDMPLGELGDQAGFRIIAPKGAIMGQSVAHGDFDGDGCSDLAVYSDFDSSSQPREAIIIYGRQEGFPDSLRLDTLDATTSFRINMEFYGDRFAAGDFDDDGISDLAIASPYARGKGFGNGQGVTNVVYGRPRPNDGVIDIRDLDGENGFQIIGVRASRSGRSLATVESFGGSGAADLLLGAPDGKTPGRGAQVLYGQPSGFPQTVQLTAEPLGGIALGPAPKLTGFGDSASSAGDFNGDRSGDALIGTTDSGQGVFLVFGRKNPPSSAVVTELPTPSTVRLFHPNAYEYDLALAALGDFSGDGRDDVAIGIESAKAVAGPFWAGGAVFVLNGRKKPLPEELNLEFLTPDFGSVIVGPADAFGKNGMYGIGKTVANAGDVNGDGGNDMLVTVDSTGSESSQFGAIFVVYGKKPDDSTAP
jgi:hypothetical protein